MLLAWNLFRRDTGS